MCTSQFWIFARFLVRNLKILLDDNYALPETLHAGSCELSVSFSAVSFSLKKFGFVSVLYYVSIRVRSNDFNPSGHARYGTLIHLNFSNERIFLRTIVKFSSIHASLSTTYGFLESLIPFVNNCSYKLFFFFIFFFSSFNIFQFPSRLA